MVAEHFHAGLRVWIISRLEAQFCNSYKEQNQTFEYRNLSNIHDIMSHSQTLSANNQT